MRSWGGAGLAHAVGGLPGGVQVWLVRGQRQAEAPQVSPQEGLGRASTARLKQRDWQAHRLVPGTMA